MGTGDWYRYFFYNINKCIDSKQTPRPRANIPVHHTNICPMWESNPRPSTQQSGELAIAPPRRLEYFTIVIITAELKREIKP